MSITTGSTSHFLTYKSVRRTNKCRSDVEVWSDTDMVFSNFFKQCVKSPDTCILARRNATADDLEKSVYNLLDDIKYQPIVHGRMLIEHGLIKALIRSSLNNPPLWPKLACAFEYLLTGNATGFLETQKSLMPSGANSELSDPLFGIPCSEKKTGKHSLNQVMPTIRELNDKSKLQGSTGNVAAMICSQWKFDAKERYDGDFRVKTKHPMLVIGNTYDPTTSLRSAQNITATFEGSVLLEHGGFGVSCISILLSLPQYPKLMRCDIAHLPGTWLRLHRKCHTELRYEWNFA